jgi:hypothetical protein
MDKYARKRAEARDKYKYLLDKTIKDIYHLILISTTKDDLLLVCTCLLSDIPSFMSDSPKFMSAYTLMKDYQVYFLNNPSRVSIHAIPFLDYLSSWNMPFTTFLLSIINLYHSNVERSKELFCKAYEMGYHPSSKHIEAACHWLDKLAKEYEIHNRIECLYNLITTADELEARMKELHYYRNHYYYAVGEAWHQNKVREYQGVMKKKIKRKRSQSL